MRHKHNNRILGRNAARRGYLLRALTSALLQHQTIVTTAAKAKELRRFVEPLITTSKEQMTLARRRALISKLPSKEDLPALVRIGQANQQRPGGYLRLTRLPSKRHDAASMVRVDIIDTK